MTDKQKLARQRNYNKFRLLGFALETKCMTEDEKRLYKHIRESIGHILANYLESNTEMGIRNTQGKCANCGASIIKNQKYCSESCLNQADYES